MAEPSNDGQQADPDSRTVGDYATSSLLVVFTLLVGIACAVMLSSTLTQTRMSGITVNGVNINIWKLNDISTKWSEIRRQISGMSDELAAVEKTRRELASQKLKVEAEFTTKRSELVVVLAEFNLRMAAANPPAHANASEQPSEDPATQYWRIQAQRESLLKDHADLRPLLDNIDAAYQEYRPARQARTEIRAITAAIPAEIKVFQDAIDGTRTSLDTVFDQIGAKVDEGTRARVENVLYELNSGWLSKFLNPLIKIQPDILTLTLVILMGVLGSALQITYSFFRKQQSERLGAYFLRVCVGAITALVIFIVAKAGVPVIADASRLGGDAPINPYFVSFLAIISGLMSERAIISVQLQAARFFGPDGGDTLRWARQDLHTAFTTANRKPEDVRNLLDVDNDIFEDWISGTKAMPADAQKMIAGVLGKPQRELFTDIAPDDPDATGKNKPLATP
jgi:hypothetical protein